MESKLPGFFRRAWLESLLTDDLRISVGAVVSKGGSVVSVGHNQKKTHPLTNTFSLHAEAATIISRRYDTDSLIGCTIWVYRELSTGKPAMAKPCKDCMRLIVAAGIKTIYFTTDKEPYWKRIDI